MAQPAIRILKQARHASKRISSNVTKTSCTHKPALPGRVGFLPAAHEASESERRRLRVLYSKVNDGISRTGSQKALQFVHRALTHRGRIGNAIRVEFIKLSIDNFLDAGDWDAAHSLYCRMRAEALPQRGGVLEKMLRRSRKIPGTESKVDQAIRDAANVMDKVDEPELQAILAHFIRGKAEIFVIRELTKMFQEKKGPKWRPSWKTYGFLAQAEAQNGYNLAAEEYFRLGRVELYRMKDKGELTRAELRSFKEDLYTHLFVGHASFNLDRPALFNSLLLRMGKDHVSPRQRIYNIMIALYAKCGHGERAFAFYRSMRLSDPTILPNATTFRHLFSLLLTPTSKWWKLKQNERRLFKQMAHQHLENTGARPENRSDVLNTSVLNAALLLFMWRRDYAAATVTVKTFPACSIAPDTKTQSSVVDTLLKQINKELVRYPQKSIELWSDRMLGEVIRLWDGWSSAGLRNRLLFTVRKLSTPMHKFSRSVLDTGVDIRILLALLRRAIISSANMWPESDPVAEDALVNKAIARAYVDMFPRVC